MYTVTKRLEIAAAHRLSLNYESQCENLHGHNWIIYVTCRREELNENGMVQYREREAGSCLSERCDSRQSDGGKHRQVDLRFHSLLRQSERAGIGRECGDV